MKKLMRVLSNLDLIVSGFCLVVIVTCTVLGVVMRYIFHSPFQWLEEVSTLFFTWLVFFGASVAVKTDNHVSIDLLVERFPAKLRRAVDVFAYAMLMLVLGFIAYYGMKLTLQVSDKITPILRIPYQVIDIALPVGAVLMLVNFSVRYFRRDGKGETE
ncbi:TRAP transporter small permease [Anaerotruncus sp. AF02-27]|uniref:TRAP transporter small permease n=1 Tax=Anaerotruncus sp. AF02-27 TaxID=2292191 RepID=UPI000E4DE629|nr:TRAP transporter small permease [Anaerotruncus sp. AF02-27]RGX57022.1 TRAP transporter small permease [Anaerotruncus sp. AF02-27]